MDGVFEGSIAANVVDGAIVAGWSPWMKLTIDQAIQFLSLYLKINGEISTGVADPEAPATLLDTIQVRDDSGTPIESDASMLAALVKFYAHTDPVRWLDDQDTESPEDMGYEEIEVPFSSRGMWPNDLSMFIPNKNTKKLETPCPLFG